MKGCRAPTKSPQRGRTRRYKRGGISTLLLLKLILVPSLIATVTLASRRWGPRVGGVLTGLPLVAGPTLVFYAVEQGAAFAADAAHGTLLALISVGAYALAYTHASSRMAWPGALALAGLAWTATTVLFYMNQIPALPGLGALAASCALAYWFMPALGVPVVPGAHPRWDLALRMTAAATLVLALTSAAEWHGPNLGGSLRGVSPRQAAWRPAPGRHNIWELAVHAAYWKYAAWRRLTGATRGSFPLAGSNFLTRPVDITVRAWRADLDLLEEMHRTLRAAAAAVPANELDRPSAQRGVTRRALLTGVAAHDLYHAGQIQLLKRLGGKR